jgi:syntaxin of plants SYP5
MVSSLLPITAPPSSSVDQWTKRFQEAERLVDDVAEGIAERDAVPPSLLREAQRQTAAIRRKVTILGTRMDMLNEELNDLPRKQNMSVLAPACIFSSLGLN